MKGTPMKLALTTPELIAAIHELEDADVPTSTAAYWAKIGIVTPSVAWSRQRGRTHQRLYSVADLIRARLVVRMRRAGIPMSIVRTCLAYHGDELADVVRRRAHAELVIDGVRAVIVRRGQHVELPSGQIRLPLRDVAVDAETVRRLIAA
jgi:DNA-binding transcriptional MerR regulator